MTNWAVTISWTVPVDPVLRPLISKFQICYSSTEMGPLSVIATIAAGTDPAFTTSYVWDPGTFSYWFTVNFLNAADAIIYTTTATSSYSRREQRLINEMKAFATSYMAALTATDAQYSTMLRNSLYLINGIPPVTTFVVEDFPVEWEAVVKFNGIVQLLLMQILGVSIQDFSYSDNGLTLNIDRGDKVNKAKDAILGYITELIFKLKVDYAESGIGLGSYQIPLPYGRVLKMFENLRGGFGGV